MKKNYIAPASVTVELSTESMILSASRISLNGTDISTEGEHDGTFSSNKKGWNSSDWSKE
ncbi:MAG: hypothetical protein Q4E59_02730 [Bacteroidales bacterium]|nr:hypothetical protein [Bacteroidales bacterium]